MALLGGSLLGSYQFSGLCLICRNPIGIRAPSTCFHTFLRLYRVHIKPRRPLRWSFR